MANIIKITLEADDRTKGAFDQAKSSTEGLISSLKSHWVAIAASATAMLLATNRAINFAKEIASSANEIQRQAGILGLSTTQYQRYTYAAKMSDVTSQDFSIGLKMLSRNIEDVSQNTGDAARYFKMMDISITENTGKLRPLDEIMLDIADRFSSWEDGWRKNAIAMALFGRSGEQMIPFLNRGRSGIQGLGDEAVKLGTVLGDVVVKKGSEAEEIFKKLEARTNATRISLAPLALEFSKTIDSILRDFNRLNDWLQRNKTTDWFPQLKKLNQWLKENSLDQWLAKLGIYTKRFERQEEEKAAKLGVPEWIREWVAGYGKKAQPPTLPPATDVAKEVMSALESVIQLESERGEVALAQHELEESGWAKEKDIVEEVTQAIEAATKAEEERGKVATAQQDLKEAGWEREKKQLELRRQMTEVDINRQVAAIRLDRERLVIGKEEALRKEIDLQNQLLEIYEKQIEKVDQIADPAGYMALYNAIDSVRGRLNELNVQLETTTGTALQGFIRGIKEYADQIKSIFEITRDSVKGLLNSMGDAFEDWLATGKMNWESFASSLRRIWAKTMRNMAESFISDFLKQITGGTSQGAGGAPGWTGLIGLIGGLFGSLFKSSGSPTGGLTTSSGGINWNVAPWHRGKGPGELPLYYRIIPRFHEGIGPDEILSVIRKDESVLTPAQMKALAPAGNISLSMPISISGTSIDAKTARKLRDDTERFVIEKLKEYSR